MHEDAISRFLADYEADSPERKYFEVVLDVLTALDPPIDEITGFACIDLFYFSTIELEDGRMIGSYDDVMGSREDISYCVAVLFRDINSDPIWWKVKSSRFLVHPDAYKVTRKVDELIEQLRGLEIIKRVVYPR